MMDFLRHNKETVDGVNSTLLDQAKLRLILAACIFMLGYLAISLRLIDLTLISNPHQQKAAIETKSEAIQQTAEKNLRGSIFDRNGELVATSLRMASVHANATLIENPEKVAQDLARILTGENEIEIAKKLSSGKKFIWISRNITPKQEYAINALGIPGISFQEESRRIYPNERLTSHLVGYTDVDGTGIAGIEKAQDKKLKDGDDPVRLTIDLRIQHILHREISRAVEKFNAKAGIGMVMDVNSGEIIAMVSLPDFDPYHPTEASDDARFNRCVLGVFEMGSTFKLFSTAAALDSGKVDFSSRYDAINPIKYGRFTISDYHPEKRILTVPEIFIHSSNIGTARMILDMGAGKLRDFYAKMGFFEQVPTAFPERGKPLYPKAWKELNAVTASFGHGVAVSPLHLMRAASALVNGGIMIKPHFTIDGKKKLMPMKPEGERVVSSETSQKVRELLALVVADGEGTGSKARVEGYDVGGKTGTAEKIGGKTYSKDAVFSSFIGFYPIESPRYAVLAILDEPKATKDTYGYATGGWTAAPVVGRVIEQMGPLYQIPPHFDASKGIVKKMSQYITKKGNGLAAAGTDH